MSVRIKVVDVGVVSSLNSNEERLIHGCFIFMVFQNLNYSEFVMIEGGSLVLLLNGDILNAKKLFVSLPTSGMS